MSEKQWLLCTERDLHWRYKRLNFHKINNYFEKTRSVTMEFYTQQNHSD